MSDYFRSCDLRPASHVWTKFCLLACKLSNFVPSRFFVV